jgi:predicted cupin superfamily sugar epimerase
MVTADWLIEHLGLEVLPEEGGLYRQTYKAGETIPREALPARYQGPRSFGTAIFYMLTPDSFSALHRLPTDEVYHFYLGDAVEMLLLFPDGRSERVILGSDLVAGQHVQFVAPAEVWQGSRLLPGGHYALMGTTMAPGFEFDDYTAGIRKELIAQYPDRAELIALLTR